MCVFSLLLHGCGSDDPFTDRLKEFRYTPESLSAEVVPRLQMASNQKQPVRSVDARTSAIQSLEAGRGGDGERPNPNSLDAIVIDVVGKFRSMESLDDTTPESNQAARESFFTSIDSTADVPVPVKEKFAKLVREQLPPLQ